MELLFSNLIAWDNLIFKIPAEKANQTAEILSTVPDSEVCRIRHAISEWVPLLLWSGSSEVVLMASVSEAYLGIKNKMGGNRE